MEQTLNYSAHCLENKTVWVNATMVNPQQPKHLGSVDAPVYRVTEASAPRQRGGG